MKNEVLRFENVHCKLDDRICLDGLFLNLFESEICGIMFNNMREREYILQLLRSELPPYYGWVYFEGRRINSKRAAELMASRIAFINADEAVYSYLTVEENIFVARRNVEWYEHVSDLCADSQEMFDELELDIKPQTKGYLLSAGDAKQVELLRAYVSGCRVAVISEIEMVMTDAQMESFFALVDKLAKRGMTFLYFATSSTKLFRYVEKIAIIKKGRTVGFMNRDNFDRSGVYTSLYGDSRKRADGILENNVVRNDVGAEVFRFVHFKLQNLPMIDVSLHAGELLSILDADYANFHHIVEVLRGEHAPEKGYMVLNGARITPRSVEHAVSLGMGIIEAKSMDRMLFMDMTVLDNLVLMLCCQKKVFFNRKKYRKMILNFYGDVFSREELDTKVYATSDECKLKLIYYKWILTKPTLLVLVRPFASVEFQMRQLTVDLIQKVLEAGIAVIIFSNQMDEAATMRGKTLSIRNNEITIEG